MAKSTTPVVTTVNNVRCKGLLCQATFTMDPFLETVKVRVTAERGQARHFAPFTLKVERAGNKFREVSTEAVGRDPSRVFARAMKRHFRNVS